VIAGVSLSQLYHALDDKSGGLLHAIGASGWSNRAGLPGYMHRAGAISCGFRCSAKSAWHHPGKTIVAIQKGNFRGGWGFAKGLFHSMRGCNIGLDCAEKSIGGIYQDRMKMIKDPERYFCDGPDGCAGGMSPNATASGLSVALGAVGDWFGGGAGGGASGGTARAASQGEVSLYRVVGPDELEVIKSTGTIPESLSGLEVKYFSATPEGAAAYARQAVRSFGDPPYTLVETAIPRSALPADTLLQVDGNVPAVILPNALLPSLGPVRVWSFMPLP
jgi:hypothetical protein